MVDPEFSMKDFIEGKKKTFQLLKDSSFSNFDKSENPESDKEDGDEDAEAKEESGDTAVEEEED